MDKNNGIEDVKEMDVKTDVTVVVSAIEAASYATERAKDELERIGGLLNVIRRCADDEAFSIVFDKEA